VKLTEDLVGVEIGGAIKNIFGIMAGMMDGLRMGSSIYGDFLTRSIVDMKTIATCMGARTSTLNGRAGLGDLAITCTSESRNFRFGREYARIFYETPPASTSDFEAILKKTFQSLDTPTVEGYYTLNPVYQFCEKHNMFVPIIRSLYSVFYLHTFSPKQAVYDYRIRDKIRIREGRLAFSHLLSFLFPRFWYRREKGFFAKFLNKKEEKALEKADTESYTGTTGKIKT
jgi:glycerol-3-phosphate dehydrogenase